MLYIGRILYIILYPGIYLFLNKTKRTRIIVRYDDQVLVLMPLLNTGKWILPGGGLKHAEAAQDSAIRELKEETGILAEVDALESMGVFDSRENLICCSYDVYLLRLESRPEVRLQKVEISRYKWVNKNQLDAISMGALEKRLVCQEML